MEKKYKIGLWLANLLSVLGLLASVTRLFSGNVVVNCVTIAFFLLIAYYAFVGYKKPHGNLLKGLMLVFAVSLMFTANRAIAQNSALEVILLMAAMILIGYIAGRLDRIQQNRFLMLLVLLLLIGMAASSVITAKGFLHAVARACDVIGWFDLCMAYLVRYSQHKEAGLMDAPKNK